MPNYTFLGWIRATYGLRIWGEDKGRLKERKPEEELILL